MTQKKWLYIQIKKIRDKENCMSYLYTEQELKRFIKSYTQNNGDIDELHIGVVERDNCFLCYEVGLKAVREKYKSYFLT